MPQLIVAVAGAGALGPAVGGDDVAARAERDRVHAPSGWPDRSRSRPGWPAPELDDGGARLLPALPAGRPEAGRPARAGRPVTPRRRRAVPVGHRAVPGRRCPRGPCGPRRSRGCSSSAGGRGACSAGRCTNRRRRLWCTQTRDGLGAAGGGVGDAAHGQDQGQGSEPTARRGEPSAVEVFNRSSSTWSSASFRRLDVWRAKLVNHAVRLLRHRGASLRRTRLHDRHRGGADDPRCRVPGARQRHRGDARARAAGRDQARADGVGAGDLDRSVRRASPRPASSCGRCAARWPTPPPAKGMAIGSAGTHPFAMWEDQRIVARPRYRDLISALRFVARQELIFGMHVHVGVDDPDKAIHVANGMRVHIPVLLGLSANSPVLARRHHRDGLDPDADLPRLSAGRDPAHLRGLGGLRAPDRVHDQRQGDRGLHLPVARRPPPPQLRHRRGPGDGLPDPHRALARAGGARPGAGPRAGRALRRGQAAVAAIRSRCSTRTSGWPPATGSRASWSTCPAPSGSPPARWRGG